MTLVDDIMRGLQQVNPPAAPPPPAGNNDAVQAAIRLGLSPELARYMPRFIKIESGGDPNARTGSYTGLLQMGPDEIRRYGGNGLEQGVRMYADRANALAKQLGRPPTPTELYLVNQQGEGGLAAHMKNPGAPAWQNMFSTAEGQKKGEAWAKRAIWGNVPDDVKARYGSVENVTSQQFMDLWKNKVERTAIPPRPPADVPQVNAANAAAPSTAPPAAPTSAPQPAATSPPTAVPRQRAAPAPAASATRSPQQGGLGQEIIKSMGPRGAGLKTYIDPATGHEFITGSADGQSYFRDVGPARRAAPPAARPATPAAARPAPAAARPAPVPGPPPDGSLDLAPDERGLQPPPGPGPLSPTGDPRGINKPNLAFDLAPEAAASLAPDAQQSFHPKPQPSFGAPTDSPRDLMFNPKLGSGFGQSMPSQALAEFMNPEPMMGANMRRVGDPPRSTAPAPAPTASGAPDNFSWALNPAGQQRDDWVNPNMPLSPFARAQASFPEPQPPAQAAPASQAMASAAPMPTAAQPPIPMAGINPDWWRQFQFPMSPFDFGGGGGFGGGGFGGAE